MATDVEKLFGELRPEEEEEEVYVETPASRRMRRAAASVVKHAVRRKRIYMLARASSLGQHRYNAKRQFHAIRVFIEGLGMEALEPGLFDYAVSGTKVDRTKLNEALEGLASGKAEGICFEKANRAGRESEVFMEVWRRVVVELGKEFYVASFGQVRTKGQANRLAGEVDEEFEDLKHQLRSGKNRHVEEEGLNPGPVPFGFKPSGAKRTLMVADEPAAEIIREMFRLKGLGLKDREVSDRLNKDGMPAGGDGQMWTALLVKGRLQNVKYKGVIEWNIKYGGESADHEKRFLSRPGAHKAIITPKLWNAAHRVIAREEQIFQRMQEINPNYHKKRCRHDPNRYLASGKTNCVVCDKALKITGSPSLVIRCSHCERGSPSSCSYFPVEMIILHAMFEAIENRPEFSKAFAKHAISEWRKSLPELGKQKIYIEDQLEAIEAERLKLGRDDLKGRHLPTTVEVLAKEITDREGRLLTALSDVVERIEHGPNIEIRKVKDLKTVLEFARHSGPLIEKDSETLIAKSALRELLVSLRVNKVEDRGARLDLKFVLPAPTEEREILIEKAYILYELFSPISAQSNLLAASVAFDQGKFRMGPATWSKFQAALGETYTELQNTMNDDELKKHFEWLLAMQDYRVPFNNIREYRYHKRPQWLHPQFASHFSRCDRGHQARDQLFAAIDEVGPTRLGLSLRNVAPRAAWAPFGRIHYVYRDEEKPNEFIRLPLHDYGEKQMAANRDQSSIAHRLSRARKEMTGGGKAVD